MSAFWFHYNKPASAQEKRPVMSVHFKGACHLVHQVVCDVRLVTRERTTQPRMVMWGRGVVRLRRNTLNDGRAYTVATITAD